MNAFVIGMCLATLASEANNETPRNDTVSNPLTAKWTGPTTACRRSMLSRSPT